MKIKEFFDSRTDTLSYIVYDESTRDAVVIDPVLDYDPVGSKIWTDSTDALVDFLRRNELRLHFVLETHAHADHLSGARHIQERFPEARLAIGEGIVDVQRVFKGVFDLPDAFPTDGRQFDRLLEDGETLRAGALAIEVIFTPGHTPACASYLIDDALFTGDALFMPDMGTGRCDFPAGSAETLFDSITRRIYTLPDSTRIFVGHDYCPNGRPLAFQTTVAEQKASNVRLNANTTREEFVAFRRQRDKSLAAPRLLFQSVQVNVDGGTLPSYFKIPLNVFRPTAKGDLEYRDV
ncbi:MAG: MBL fold metallo-hydrolase [Myxococcales bacterium]|nr:MBL fold metallo-hydrolase [Myxococcales bacterium]